MIYFKSNQRRLIIEYLTTKFGLLQFKKPKKKKTQREPKKTQREITRRKPQKKRNRMTEMSWMNQGISEA
jgi:hypothetical protein